MEIISLIVIILLLGYLVFRDILYKKQIDNLQALAFGSVQEEKIEEDNYQNEELVPLSEVENNEQLLKALQEEEITE